MQKIKRVSVQSLCKTVFFLDLIVVVFVLVPISLIPLLTHANEGKTNYTWLMPVMMVAIHPLAVTLGAAIFGFLYNVITPYTGGIKIELEQ